MCGTDVCIVFGSTMMRPRLSAAIPAAVRLSVSVALTLPAANSSMSVVTRRPRNIDDLVAVEHGRAIERDVVGPVGPGAAGDQDMARAVDELLAVLGRDLDLVRPDEAAFAACGADAVAIELVLEHFDLMVE